MYEFPRSTQFDSDLREIIEMMKPLFDFYKEYGTIILNLNNKDKLFPLTVKYYGAKGDGIADDTDAIERAIENLDYVIFTPGTYRISRVLNFTNKKVMGIGATIDVTNTAECKFDNCVVYGLEFKSITPQLSLCTSINNGSIFKDCVFKPSYIGVGIAASPTIIDSCRFYGNGTAPFGIWADVQENPPTAINVDNCYFEKFWLNAIFGYGNPLVVTNSTFIDNHLQTVPTGGGHLDLISYDADKNYGQSIISNCRIMGGNALTSGIETDDANVTITNCVITTPYNGIVLQHTDNALITGNYIYGCGNGIYLPDVSKATIDGNRIMNNTSFDIRADVALDDCVITNNTFTPTSVRETSVNWNGTVFNGRIFGNVPEWNNINFQTVLGTYEFKIHNDRPAILKVVSASQNAMAILTLQANGLVEKVSDPSDLYPNHFTLEHSNGGIWRLSIVGDVPKYMFANYSLL